MALEGDRLGAWRHARRISSRQLIARLVVFKNRRMDHCRILGKEMESSGDFGQEDASGDQMAHC